MGKHFRDKFLSASCCFGDFSLFSFRAYGKSAFYGNRTELCFTNFTILPKGSLDLFLYKFCKKFKDSAKKLFTGRRKELKYVCVVYEAWARVTPFVAASLPLRMHKHSWKCAFVLIIIAMLIIIIAETDVSSINARQNTTKIVINISHLSQRARNMQKEREKEKIAQTLSTLSLHPFAVTTCSSCPSVRSSGRPAIFEVW